MKKSSFYSVLAAIVSFWAAGMASASCIGTCGTLGADGNITAPPGGSTYSYVVTSSTGPLITGLGLGSEKSGSTLNTSAFAANAGDALKFNFNYITSDGSGTGTTYADYAWAQLLNAANNSVVAVLFTARTTTTGTGTVPGPGMPAIAATVTPSSVNITANATTWSPLGTNSGMCFGPGCGNTGWVSSTYNIASSGNYILQFGVVNWIDTLYQSGLAFNGVTVGGQTINVSVPEPATLVLMAGGILGLAYSRRKSA